jgi:Sigma-70, region 4
MKASNIVIWLLGGDDVLKQILGEASVHRPRRGTRWVASYTDENGLQRWRSTGLACYRAALALAKRWEAEAKAKRAQPGKIAPEPKTPSHLRGSAFGGFTQAETAFLLGLSQRAVRQIERRALAKLMRHPKLRQMWGQYLSGTLDEAFVALSEPEMEALLGLARNQAEYQILKMMSIVQS